MLPLLLYFLLVDFFALVFSNGLPKKIGSFIIDLIEAIPFFIILNSGQENCDREDCFNYAFTDNIRYSLLILQILKVLKLYKNSALKMIDKFLSKNNFYSDKIIVN